MTIANYNDIPVGPVTIHMYGLMIAVGFIAAYLMCVKRSVGKGLNADIVWDILIGAVVGGILGSKILFLIVSIKDIIKDPSILWNFKNGFVVYGGVLGGVLAAYIVCKIKKVKFLQYFDLVMPSVSLGQAFGRIGCLFAGCCYGKTTDSAFHIIYKDSLFAPNGAALLPTQIISSIGDFVIMLFLLLFAKKNSKDGRVGMLYFILYGIGRFTIEFFRNDYRGEIGVLSTSQFIAVILVGVSAVVFVLMGKKKNFVAK